MDKLSRLCEMLGTWPSCLVAYSGAVDSVFLALVAKQTLGDKALAVIADSPSLPRRELEEAVSLATRFQIPLRVVNTAEFANPDYTSNPLNRCYFCKHELFTVLERIAAKENFSVLAYGENASDTGDFRPGAQAAKEFKVRAPLKEIGLTKAEIRELSAQLGLPTADKPQMACLSSRVPYGEAVSPEKLRMIEAAENVLRDRGFYDVRVRHFEISDQSSVGSDQLSVNGNQSSGSSLNTDDWKLITPSRQALARVEVGPDEVARLQAMAGEVEAALREIGYQRIEVDPNGYRRGSLNAVQALPSKLLAVGG